MVEAKWPNGAMTTQNDCGTGYTGITGISSGLSRRDCEPTNSTTTVTITPTNSSAYFITFEEVNQTNKSLIYAMKSYNFMTFIQIIRVNNSVTDLNSKIYVDRYLSIRTIYPNGTINAFDISNDKLDIQPFNFCINQLRNPIQFYPATSNFLLVTYMTYTNESTYEGWAMVVNLSGNIRSKTFLGRAYVDPWPLFQANIIFNVNHDKGFLRVVPKTNTDNITLLQQFIISNDGTVQNITEEVEISSPPSPNPNLIQYIATMDNGYAIIYANISDATGLSHGGIYGRFLNYERINIRGPMILYQIPSQGLNFTALYCDNTFVGVGQTCTLAVNPTTLNTYYITKIDFLTSGLINNIQMIPVPDNIQMTPFLDYSQCKFKLLPYGGYFISNMTSTTDPFKNNIDGYILNDNGFYRWNLTNPSVTNFKGDFIILPNNTLMFPQSEGLQSWNLTVIGLYNALEDHGYDNLNIDTISLVINDIIDASATNLIIKYYNKVDLSNDGYLLIYQRNDDGEDILRQLNSVRNNYNNKYISYKDEEKGTIVSVKTIRSTFNKPGGSYYVLIEDGFVKRRTFDTPIFGIQRKSVWTYTTNQTQENSDGNKDVEGKVRLTPEGTTHFLNLDIIKREEFYKNLANQLANANPISPKRITTSGKYETDATLPKDSPKQIILSIDIKRYEVERLAVLAARDLDSLIKNKYITVLASGNASIFLDSDYGYQTLPGWIDVNWTKLLGTAVFEILLFLSFAAKKYSVIFECVYAIADFITGIIFATVDSQMYHEIYIISVFFVILPFIVNLGFAFKITIGVLVRELTLKKSDEDIKGSNPGESNTEESNREESNKKESTRSSSIIAMIEGIEGTPDTKDTKELKKTYESLIPSQKSKYNKLSDESKISFLKLIRKGNRLNNIVVIYTLLGGINIENLNLIELDLLNTNIKLSPSSRSNIVWGAITNTFIEKNSSNNYSELLLMSWHHSFFDSYY
ncbi:hypothetical protein RhiirC2_770970 [Rhizophagus irregularis]|uniref:Uncharacterized protein n=1 Tax=Rhizophagus irregularis TaxID=588596 RepID=A0A2N1NV42_9GLOM|nr:hypothetical protein RhiirC2_770970 [Rhizophagus irregularis]